jgi:hypothetical protein
VTDQLRDAKKLLNKWLPKFGFAHYSRYVELVPEDQKGKTWAMVKWDHDEEFVVFYFVPDGVLPKEQLEVVVLHELAHGLISLANESAPDEERVCNRIARILAPQVMTTNEWMQHTEPPSGGWYPMRVDPAAAPLVRILVDEALSDLERQVVNRFYYERLGVTEIALELGITYGHNIPDVHKVKRILRRAERTIGDMLEEKGLVDG